MIKFKEGGLIDRWITVYGRCPEEGKNNFCTVWWRAVVGLLVICIICVFPTIAVLTDLHLYYVKVVGVESLLFCWVPVLDTALEGVVYLVLIVVWCVLVVGTFLLQIGLAVFAVLYLFVLAYNKIASVNIINYSVKSYSEPLGRVSASISKVTKPVGKSISTGINNIKEVYNSIKDKYCPTVVWVKEEK